MKNKTLAILGLIIIFAGTFFYFYNVSSQEVIIKGNKFKAELAVSKLDREHGLSGREKICKGCAMLFIFEEPGKYSFWMKDMRFSLDIIWILDNKIVYIANSVPADSKENIWPSVLADKVLEINGGLAEEYGFKAGDSVKF